MLKPAVRRAPPRPASHNEPRPQTATGYSGAVDARRDAVTVGKLSPTVERAAAVPALPAYLATPAGRVRPPPTPARPDRGPTPPQRLPPAKGLADKPPDRPAPAAPSAARHPAARPAAGGQRRRPAEEPEPPPPAPLPEIDAGAVTLSRPAIAVDASAPPFDAPRSLAARAATPAERLEPNSARYRETYAAAAAASYSLYARIVGGLGTMAGDARAEADRASTRRQRDLDAGLRTLDTGLATSRGRLRITLDDDLARLDGAAFNARQRIVRAAGSGIARLRARAKRLETDLKGERGRAATIAAMPAGKIAELGVAQLAVTGSLANLAANAASLLPAPDTQHGDAMKAAEFEAMVRDIAFPVKEAGLELRETVALMIEGLQAQIEPTARSICMAFCPFEQMKELLAGEAEEAVGKARAQSLKQLDAMHRRLRRQLVRSLHEGERTLLEQHRGQRRRLVEAAGDRQRHEQAQHQQQARTGTAMLAASAGAQSAALSALHGRIAGQAERGEEALATAASELARGLIANGVPRGREQLAAVEARIAGAAATLAGIGRMASQRFEEGARGAVAAYAADVRKVDDTAADQVRRAEPALLALARPITETVDGFIRSVNRNAATAMTNLGKSLSDIESGLTRNFAGQAPEPEKKGEGEAAKCDSCPPAPAPKPKEEGGKDGSKPEPVATYLKRLAGYVPAPATERNVESYRKAVPRLVFDDINARSRALHRLLCYTDSAPYSVLDQLRGITRLQGAALEEKYNAEGASLRKDLDWFLNAGNPASGITTRTESIRAARDYLNGDVASGARHELNVCVNWSNDSAQIDKVMASLTEEQMAEMFQRFPDELEEVRDDLSALDTKVFDALAIGDVGKAVALRGVAEIDSGRKARGYKGTDKAGDAINTMYAQAGVATRREGGPALPQIEGARTRAERVAAKWRDIQADFAVMVGPAYDRPIGGGLGPPAEGDAIVNYAARGIAYHANVPNRGGRGTHRAARFDAVDEEQVRLLTALVRHHAGSPEARAARGALEATRPGGSDPKRLLEATYNQDLNPALVVDNPPSGDRAAAERRYNQAVADEQRTYELLDRYLGRTGDKPRDTAEVKRDFAERLAAGLPHNKAKADYLRSLVLADPRNEPEFVAQTVKQLDYAMEGAGTNVDALRHAVSQLTREQYLAVKAQWAVEHDGEDLDVRIGIPGHGSWFERLIHGETSGDTALEMERLRYGIPKNQQEVAELAALEMFQQIREANDSWLGPTVAREEFDQLNADYRHLLGLMGTSGLRIGKGGELQFLDAQGEPAPLGHFEGGKFKAPPGVTAEDLALAITVGKASAAAYVAATDRIANLIATALVVAAAIITTALTGGAAASIWIPILVTAGAGVLGMVVKYAIKGGRYGSEEMLFDLASTIIQAATAGLGAAAGAALRGGTKAVGALARSWRLSEQALATAAAGGATASKALPALTLGQELMIGALTAGFAGGANAAIAPDSWRSETYAQDILTGIVRGTIGGAIGAGVARSVGKIAGPLGEIPARGLAAGASGAATRIAELGFDDMVLGRHVTWSEMMDEASTAFLQNLIQGIGEGAADRAMRQRFAGRAAEHDWHQANSHEAFVERAAALKRAAEAELAARGVAANDNPPPIADVPEIAPEAGPRRTSDGDPSGRVTARIAADEEPAAFPRGRTALSDEHGPLLRPHGDAAEPVARLRSASGFDDDEPTQPGIRIEPPTFPNGVDLQPGMLDHLPPILADTPVRGTDKYDGEQARLNYEVMRARLPNQEVLLAYNPSTGEFMAVQGLPHSVTPPPEGWITLRHSHPRVIGGDMYSQLATILPSGIGGDFSVLKTEVDRLAGGRLDVEFRRSSVIDIEIDGQRSETVFTISKKGDNYSLTVQLIPPQHGVGTLGPFPNIREYAYVASALTAHGADFGLRRDPNLPNMMTEGGGNAPRRVVRNATLAEAEAADAAFVAARMASAAAAAEPSRAALTAEAHERVRAMGLVGATDSLMRLTRLLNSADPALTPEMRSALAQATLEATRAEMIRNNELKAGDDLLLLFRGVTSARLGNYEEGGIDLSLLGRGSDEDAGRGLYGSQDFQSALRYTGDDGNGAVLPLIVRKSELGNVIDVRSGTPLGDRWLAYLRQVGGPGRIHKDRPYLAGLLDTRFGTSMSIGRDGRGVRFEAFLKTIAQDATLSDDIRAAAADPHITLMDLGGVASTGNDRGILTDQWAMHSQYIAELFNKAMGFPRPRSPEEAAEAALAEAGSARLRSAAAPKPDAADAAVAEPVAAPAKVADEVAGPRPSPDGDSDLYPRPSAQEDLTAAYLDAVMEAHAELHAPRPPATTYREALDQASNHQRAAWRDAALAEFAARHPGEYARLAALLGNDIGSVRAILMVGNEQGRDHHVGVLQARLGLRGYSAIRALEIAREAVGLASDAHHRLALMQRHLVEREVWRAQVEALPAALKGMAGQSSLLLYLAARHGALLQTLHTQFLAQPNLLPAQITPALFESFVARQLAGHPVQPETAGRRIVRFTSEADFNQAAASATPHTRYEFGRLAYTTDAQGRVSIAEGVPVRVKGHRSSSSLQTAIGNRGYATDVGFHLIAHIFGAVVNELTVVPGNGQRISGDPEPNLNGSAYKVQFENIVRTILDTTDQIVEVRVESIYNSGNATSRPDVFEVRFRTDAGRWRTARFVNKF